MATTSAAAIAIDALISVTSASVANIWTSIGGLTLPSAIAIAPPSRRMVSAPLDERRGVEADPGLGLQRVGVPAIRRRIPAARLAASASCARLKASLTGSSRRIRPQTMPVPTSAPTTNASPDANTRPKTNGRSASEKECALRRKRTWTTQISANGEPERDRPPGQVRVGVRGVVVGDEHQARAGEHGQRDHVHPDEGLA